MSDNVVLMNGNKMRTAADVVHELNEKLAAGEIRDIMVVITDHKSYRHIDWSNQTMSDFSYSCTSIQHNLMIQMGGQRSHE
jgi:hypothetical protein